MRGSAPLMVQLHDGLALAAVPLLAAVALVAAGRRRGQLELGWLPHRVLASNAALLALVAVASAAPGAAGEACGHAYLVAVAALHGVVELAHVHRALFVFYVSGVTVELLDDKPERLRFHRRAWLTSPAFLVPVSAAALAARVGGAYAASSWCGGGLAWVAGAALPAAAAWAVVALLVLRAEGLRAGRGVRRELLLVAAVHVAAALAAAAFLYGSGSGRGRAALADQAAAAAALLVSSATCPARHGGRVRPHEFGSGDTAGPRTVEAVLRHPVGCETLTEFLVEEWSVENALFWGAAEDFRRTAEGMLAEEDTRECRERVHIMARAVCARFVEAGSTHEVNLGHACRAAACAAVAAYSAARDPCGEASWSRAEADRRAARRERMRSTNEPCVAVASTRAPGGVGVSSVVYAFDTAQWQVLQLVACDSWPRFLRAPGFSVLLDSLLDGEDRDTPLARALVAVVDRRNKQTAMRALKGCGGSASRLVVSPTVSRHVELASGELSVADSVSLRDGLKRLSTGSPSPPRGGRLRRVRVVDAGAGAVELPPPAAPPLLPCARSRSAASEASASGFLHRMRSASPSVNSSAAAEAAGTAPGMVPLPPVTPLPPLTPLTPPPPPPSSPVPRAAAVSAEDCDTATRLRRESRMRKRRSQVAGARVVDPAKLHAHIRSTA